MEVYQGLMSDVLKNCRYVLRNNRNRFGKLHRDFIKAGFIGQTPIYPAISVVPSSQAIVQRRANREYIIGREIALQIYDVGISRDEAESSLQRHVDTLNTILNNDRQYFLQDADRRKIAFNFEFGNQNINSNPFQLRGRGFVMEATIFLTFFSKWYRPVQASNKPAKYSRLSDEDAFRRVFDKLDRQRHGGKLAMLRRISKSEGIPRERGITAALRVVRRGHDRYAAAMDLDNLQYQFTVWSKILPDEMSLLDNCDVTEAAFEIIDQDETFGGAFYDSNLDVIQWREKIFGKNEPPYYETILNFTCAKPELTMEGTQA